MFPQVSRIIPETVAGLIVVPPDPYPQYPVVAYTDATPAVPATSPFIAVLDDRLMWAVCTYCPSTRDVDADPADLSTCLEYYDSGYDLDEQRAALTRRLGHYDRLPTPTDPLPIWTWSEHACPRWHAEAGKKCLTKTGYPSTIVHSSRCRDHIGEYW